jgi:glutathione S-transferase
VTDLILHHYGMSPFSEKARRILAFKKLPFRSVRAPAVMPKPDFVALTGGYRRVPILQIGADVYCDTALIARVLERLAPAPTLYPSPLAEIVAEWADSALFELTVPIAMRPTRFDDIFRLMTPEELGKIQEDRAEMRRDARRGGSPYAVAKVALPATLDRLDRQLSRSPFLLGDAPCIADFSVFHSVWFLETAAPEPVAPFEHLRAWAARIREVPSTEGETIPAEEALALCKQSTPGTTAGVTAPGTELTAGAPVIVRAADYGRDPIHGELSALTADEIVIRREDPRAGTVAVHFPRLGYEVARAE